MKDDILTQWVSCAAKEASKRIVEDLLVTAGAEDITDSVNEQDPSLIRRAEGLDDDSFWFLIHYPYIASNYLFLSLWTFEYTPLIRYTLHTTWGIPRNEITSSRCLEKSFPTIQVESTQYKRYNWQHTYKIGITNFEPAGIWIGMWTKENTTEIKLVLKGRGYRA